MNFRAIKAIFKKDIIDGSKNYHIILMVLTPIILSLLFTKLLGNPKSKSMLPTLGIISSPQQPILKSIADKGFGKKIKFFQNRDELETKILEGEVGFGIILPELISSNKNSSLSREISILYPPKYPEFSVKSIKEAFESELRQQLGLAPAPLPIKISMIKVAGRNGQSSFGSTMFPMLVLMAIGMIGFLALPLALVEEREKGTLNALFLTPVKPSELIIGKTLFSFFLIMFTVVIMLFLNQIWNENMAYFGLFVLLGSLLSIFIGLIISNFAKTQGSVNALGTTVFLFFQLIPNLRNTSDAIKSLSHFFPSTYIFSGIKKALFLDLNKVPIKNDLLTLLSFTLGAYLIAFLCFKFKKADN